MVLKITPIRPIIFMLFFTGYTFTNENIIYGYMNDFFNYVSKATGHVTIIPYYISIDQYSISNTTGSLISPKYKKNFTFPEEAWCIAENIFYREDEPFTYKIIYYEDKNDIKMVQWSEHCIPEITIIQNQDRLKKLFAIRTIHSLTYGNLKTYIEKRKKYLLGSDITQSNSVIDYNGDRIFNEFLPNEIVPNMIIYLDYKTLFCTLPCVSKKFDKFIKEFDTCFNIKKSIQKDSDSYTQLVSNMLLSDEQPFPINVLHDPRFFHKKFKKKWNISIEETVWDSSFILTIQNNKTYLVRSKNRTDQQFAELLKACSLNEAYTPTKIFQKKAKRIISSIKNRLDSLSNLYEYKECFQQQLKEYKLFFIYSWDALYQALLDKNDKRSNHFYNRPCILKMLINLLYENLTNKKIDLKDIPFTFFKYARNIANPIYIKADQLLSYDDISLKETLEKNRNYRNYILFEDQQDTPYSNSIDELDKKNQTYSKQSQKNERVLSSQSQNDSPLKLSNKQAILNRSKNIITLLFVWITFFYIFDKIYNRLPFLISTQCKITVE